MSTHQTLFGRKSRYRVSTRQVYEIETISFVRTIAFFHVYRDTAIIAYLHVHTRESIEQCRFTRIRIAYQSYVYLSTFLESHSPKIIFGESTEILSRFLRHQYFCLFFGYNLYLFGNTTS